MQKNKQPEMIFADLTADQTRKNILIQQHKFKVFVLIANKMELQYSY